MIAIINPHAPAPVVQGIYRCGFTPVTVPLCKDVQAPLAGHPDVQLCIIDSTVIHHPGMDDSFLQLFHNSQYTLLRGQSILQSAYPYDCAYNCAYTGTAAFHNTTITDSSLRNIISNNGAPLIHVNQGYTKCSVCIVSEKAIISSDTLIHKAALANDIDSLLISSGHIDLPGFRYGFIGGASGMYNDTVYFTGVLTAHPDGSTIIKFIEKHDKKIVYLSSLPIIDAGSIFFIDIEEPYCKARVCEY